LRPAFPARLAAFLVGVALLLVGVPDLRATPKVHMTRQVNIEIELVPMTAPVLPGTPPGSLRMVVRPEQPAETGFRVHWPEPDSVTHVKLLGKRTSAAGSERHEVALEAELVLPDGSKVRSGRLVQLEERATTLFELYRLGERALTMVVEAEATEEVIVSRHAAVGAPVRFRVEIQRVEAGRAISLETDILQTFVGESVSYGFRLGEAPESDAVRLSLRPLRISGELVEIKVETDGTLPGEDGLTVLARSENLVASRGVVSTLAFESGDPPTGYRFLVTAEF
jgi:hypothetical protein